MKLVRIPTEGPPVVEDHEKELHVLYRAIGNGCSLIEEAWTILSPTFGWWLLVDEEGLYNPLQSLNQLASIIHGQQIVGDALMVQFDGDRDWVDLTDPELAVTVLQALAKYELWERR